MKKDYSFEYLKAVREYLVNPKDKLIKYYKYRPYNMEILDIMKRLNNFFEYIKLHHDDNSKILVVRIMEL